MTRTAVIAVLVGILGGAGYLYQRHQSKIYRELAEENRSNLVRFQVANGVRRLDEGDLLGSLPWFVEALRLDEGNPDVLTLNWDKTAATLRWIIPVNLSRCFQHRTRRGFTNASDTPAFESNLSQRGLAPDANQSDR